MPLPPPASARTPVHLRSIEIQAFRRDDGRWELEARLSDVKDADYRLASGVRRAGEPIHDMTIRVTLDTQLTVVDVVAASDAVPYSGACESITGDYAKLVGLNLLQSFRRRVRERLGEVRGCTHLSELATVLPTAAIQAFGAELGAARELARAQAGDPEKPPFFLDRCHATRFGGETVRHYYPKWFRPEDPNEERAA